MALFLYLLLLYNNSIMRSIPLLIIAFSLAACNNSRQEEQEKPVATESSAPQTRAARADDAATAFVAKAASSSMMEIALGQLAQQKAQNPRVAGYGRMMMEAHGKANDTLKALAAARGISVPASINEQDRKQMEALSSAKGRPFEGDYIRLMIKAHRADIALFRKAANSLEDDGLRSFAEKQLPVLNKHLDLALVLAESKRKQMNNTNKEEY